MALDRHDISFARRVLDLGCGFGFMAEEVARRVHAQAVVTGVDALPANREPFVARVRGAGRQARFVTERLESALPCAPESFDLVVSSYSLYFFPQIIPEVSRVLARDGLFLAVTHSMSSTRAVLRLAGLPVEGSPLLDQVGRFCAERGGEVLSRCFGRVERVDYPNHLRFSAAEVDELVAYLRFKFSSISDWPESESELAAMLARDLGERLRTRGDTLVEKNDAAFWAREPLCR